MALCTVPNHIDKPLAQFYAAPQYPATASPVTSVVARQWLPHERGQILLSRKNHPPALTTPTRGAFLHQTQGRTWRMDKSEQILKSLP